MDYEHTQSSRMTRMGLGLAIAVLTVVLLAVDEPAVRVVLGVVVLVLALTWVMFSALTVSIDSQHLNLRFGPGPIRKRFELSSIEQVRAVRNTWLHGWGIHLTSDGWVWNVAGFGAVELLLRNGRRFRVGTDQPAALVEALERALRRGSR
jgi:hypothetical protein